MGRSIIVMSGCNDHDMNENVKRIFDSIKAGCDCGDPRCTSLQGERLSGYHKCKRAMKRLKLKTIKIGHRKEAKPERRIRKSRD